MIKLLQTLLGVLLLNISFFSNAVEVDKTNPYVMIEKVADLTFTRFANEQADIQKNPNMLKDIVREELMPYIDYKYAAYKVLGSYLKKTTKAERKAFVPVFRDYLITSYAQVFTLYNKQKVEFEPKKNISSKTKILAVKTTILEPGRNPIDISFKVRKNKKTKQWKAFDMIAEGISLLDSKQSELNGVIRQNGLAHVTNMLKEKATRDIVFKSKEK